MFVSLQSANPELDPVITKACGDDIKSLCPAGVSVDNLLECLRGKKKELSKSCHKTLFKIEMVQAVDRRADSVLVKACRRAIEKFCRDEEDDKLLACLVEAQNGKLDIDAKCSKIVMARQVEEATDIRLNPAFYKDCKQDALKFCPAAMNDILQRDEEAETLEYKLVKCLKDSKKAKKSLSDSCDKRLAFISAEAASNYKLVYASLHSCEFEVILVFILGPTLG